MINIRQHYTDEMVDILLNEYFRDHARPTPYPTIAEIMGVSDHEGLNDLLWKVITGYNGREPRGLRRCYEPTPKRINRTGWVWQAREDAALMLALRGEGQLRRPPCDTEYVAAVLGRSWAEVETHWNQMNEDVLGREGFGL